LDQTGRAELRDRGRKEAGFVAGSVCDKAARVAGDLRGVAFVKRDSRGHKVVEYKGVQCSPRPQGSGDAAGVLRVLEAGEGNSRHAEEGDVVAGLCGVEASKIS